MSRRTTNAADAAASTAELSSEPATEASTVDAASSSPSALIITRADERLAAIVEESDALRARIAGAQRELAEAQNGLIEARQRAATAQATYREIERDVAQARAMASLAKDTSEEATLVARVERLEQQRDGAELELTEAMRVAQVRETSAQQRQAALTSEIAQAQMELEQLAGEHEAVTRARAEAHAREGALRQAAVEAELQTRREGIEALDATRAEAVAELERTQAEAYAFLEAWPERAAAYRNACQMERTPAQEFAQRWLALAEWLDQHGTTVGVLRVPFNREWESLSDALDITGTERAMLFGELDTALFAPRRLHWTRRLELARAILAGEVEPRSRR